MVIFIRCIALLAVGLVLQLSPAAARSRYAAVALSKMGTQYGSSTNHDTLADAEQAALAQCSRYASDCEIFKSIESGCMGLTIARNGAAAWSTTVGPPALRQAKSLAECRRQGGDVCDYIADICTDDPR